MLKHFYSIILLAALCVCLIYDTAQLFRITFMCAALHEAAHIFVYIIITRKLPHIRFKLGAVQLSRANALSKRADIAVTLAGPAANFAAALAAYIYITHVRASYMLYFICAINICTGAYNLLPIGVLDGARLIKLLTPAKHLGGFYKFQNILTVFISAFLCFAALTASIPLYLRFAMLLSAAYIFYSAFKT